MPAKALECAVAYFGVGIYPNNSLRRNQNELLQNPKLPSPLLD
jgi:hypothetical protein